MPLVRNSWVRSDLGAGAAHLRARGISGHAALRKPVAKWIEEARQEVA